MSDQAIRSADGNWPGYNRAHGAGWLVLFVNADCRRPHTTALD